MDLLSLALSLALPMEGAEFTGDYTFDINPVVGIPLAGGIPWGSAATTIPGAVLYDDRVWQQGTVNDFQSNPQMRRHELTHADQQAALGPAFWLGYLGTGGRAFEPYDSLSNLTGLPSSYGTEHDMRSTWTPPPDMPRDFPLFRIEKDGDTTSIQFMPGYPGVKFDAP